MHKVGMIWNLHRLREGYHQDLPRTQRKTGWHRYSRAYAELFDHGLDNGVGGRGDYPGRERCVKKLLRQSSRGSGYVDFLLTVNCL